MKTDEQTLCFAVPGADSIIDTIDPATGRSRCYGKTLDDVRREYPEAEIVDLDDHCKAKAARQDGTARTWSEVSEERYWDMLEVLPPAAMRRGAFLVGEAQDHHAGTGRPRFSCFKEQDGKHYALSTPITIDEFRRMFP